ncbi:MAG TPA: hypothetical protein VEH56_01955 [Candidatus Saccharimonadales bacterium]|nr:hypothetical protein [Candidatus Saccharimonadales bacterium]
MNVETLNRYVEDSSLLERILSVTEVTVTSQADYMHVNDKDGSLFVGLDYLQKGEVHHLYLDIIHELIHVRQYLEGKELFDEKFNYVDRPTEIEAYQGAVDEARKLGMSEDAIADYIYVEWITSVEHERLLKTLGVKSNNGSTKSSRT